MVDDLKEQAKASVSHVIDQVCDKLAIDRVTFYGLIEEIMVDEGFVEGDFEIVLETLH